MRSKDVVQCRCGAKAWDSRGASISPEMSSQTFECTSCGGFVWILGGYGCGPMAFFHPPELTKEAENYANGPLMAQWRKVWDQHSDKVDSRPETPTPPALPAGMLAYTGVHVNGELRWIGPHDAESTKNVQAPEDPIFTRHKEYWAKLLEELGIKEYQPAKNRYCGSPLEPWYEFTLHGVKVAVGPRKRVDVIEVQMPPPFQCQELYEKGKQDGVTVDQNSIHAWTREKFVEYFHIIERALASGLKPVAWYDT